MDLSDEFCSLYGKKTVKANFKAQLKKLTDNKVNTASLQKVDAVADFWSSTDKSENPVSNDSFVDNDLSSNESSLDEVEFVSSSESCEAVVVTTSEKKGTKKKGRRKETVSEDVEVVFASEGEGLVRRSARLKKKNVSAPVDTSVIELFDDEDGLVKRKRINKPVINCLEDVQKVQVEECVEKEVFTEEINHMVTVKVIWKSKMVEKFPMRKYQKLSHIYEHFMKAEGLSQDKLIFTLNGVNIQPSDTPDSLNLRIIDFIEGGVLSTNVSAPVIQPTVVSNTDGLTITLKVQDIDKKVVSVTVKKCDFMKVVMVKYAEQVEKDLGCLKFYVDGENVNPMETVQQLDLDNEDIIDVKHF